MRGQLKKRGFTRLHAGLAALVTGILFAACVGTGSLEVGVEIMGNGGGFKLNWNNPAPDELEAEIVETPGGVRIDVGFLDDDGNLIPGGGATGVAPGDSVPVPAGAAVMVVSGPSEAGSCTGCAGGSEAPGGAGNPASRTATQVPCGSGTTDYFSAGLPIGPAVTPGEVGVVSNTAWRISFTEVTGLSAADIYSRVAPVVEADAFASPLLPGNMELDFLAKFLPNPLGLGGTLIYKDVSVLPYLSFHMDWNGSAYADLGNNSTVHALGNSWHAVEVGVPLTDFNFSGSGSSFNSIELRSRTIEDAQPVSFDASAAFF